MDETSNGRNFYDANDPASIEARGQARVKELEAKAKVIAARAQLDPMAQVIDTIMGQAARFALYLITLLLVFFFLFALFKPDLLLQIVQTIFAR